MKVLVQGNELIESAYKVSRDEMRLLCLAISRIDSKHSKPETVYRITVDEFVRTFGIDPRKAYTAMRDASISLLKNPVFLRSIDKKGRVKWTGYPWFNKIEYFADDGSHVDIEFSKYVEPYLYNISSDFTSVELENIAKLGTPFATRLYTWLIRYRSMYRNKQDLGISAIFTIDWIRDRAMLGDSYEDFRNFRQWLIDPAIKLINAHTDICVSYKPIKEGRKVTAFEFFYVDQNKTIGSNVVVRPRLPRRPKVLKGTHEEGVWARKGIALLRQYQAELKQLDKKLTLADLRRLHDYYQVLGDRINMEAISQAINKRESK